MRPGELWSVDADDGAYVVCLHGPASYGGDVWAGTVVRCDEGSRRGQGDMVYLPRERFVVRWEARPEVRA